MTREVKTSRATEVVANSINQFMGAEADALMRLDESLRRFVERGEVIPDEVLESHRKHLRNLGVSGSRFNELLFSVLKPIGDGGNYAIYDILKRSKPDGTPGMHSIRGWRERIDQAQIHAQNVFLQKRGQAEPLFND